MQSDSVALGTDTIGNYVQTISGTASEIVVTGGTGESSTPVISLPTNMVIPQDLTITGDLTVQGTTIINDTTTVAVDDPYITVGGTTVPTSDDNKDRGVRFRWHDGVSAKLGFFGFVDSTGEFTFIPDATETGEVFSGTIGDATFGTVTADLVGDVTGNADTATLASEATALETSRNIALSGDVTGNANFDGTSNVLITATVANDSHTHDTQYYTKSLSDLRYINSSGDSMAGFLTLSADPTQVLHAATKQYVDNGLTSLQSAIVAGNVATASAWETARTITINGDAAGSVSIDGSSDVILSISVDNDSHTHDNQYYNKTASDLRYINAGGDSMVGFLTLAQNPSQDFHAATKQYVDSEIVSVTSGNVASASELEVGRQIALSGAVTGFVTFDGSQDVTISTIATSDPTLTLTGDASGSATFTNLGNASLAVTVANDSHTHDGRYYTETEADSRFVNVAGDTLTGALTLAANPINNLHAATKQYVDTEISSVVGGTVVNAQTADKWTTARTITLSGDLSGNVSIDGSANVTLTASVSDDSHNHTIANVDGLQTALDGKANSSHVHNYLPISGGTMTGSVSFGTLPGSWVTSANYANHLGWNATHGTFIGGNTTGSNTYIYSDAVYFDGSAFRNLYHDNYKPSADKWTTARTLTLSGDVTGSVSWDGSANATITTVVADDSHNHTIANVDGLQTALNSKLNTSGGTISGGLTVNGTLLANSGVQVPYVAAAKKPMIVLAGATTYGLFHTEATNDDFTFDFAGVSKFTFNQTGNFTATGDVTAYSDRRFKHNIETIDNAVDTVLKLRGVSFEKDNRNSIGVIAQEVEEVLPEVVHTNEEGYKSVAYGNMVGLLIEAMKEQQSQIEALKAEIQNLKDK